MRVLILSANTGGGHNSAAAALGEQLQKMNIEYTIADTLAYISEKVSDFVSWWHSYLYRRMPKAFGIGYRYEEKHSPRFMYDQCAKGAAMLNEAIVVGEYDAVLCVHIFSGMMMTAVREKYGNFIPCYFIATDYTCSPGGSEIRVDGYFIPHRMLLGEFVRNGISADKLYATGIPVRSDFYTVEEKAEARRALQLPQEGKMVLLSCGSMGCGKMEKAAKKLADQLPPDAYLVVLCGNNTKTYEALQPYLSDRLYAVSFTKDIARYMSAADIYITKPGGLTTSEAIVKQTPMIFINAVPGCETRNFDFLIQCGVASGAKNWKHVISQVNAALQKPEILEHQKAAMRQFHTVHNTAEAICKRALE